MLLRRLSEMALYRAMTQVSVNMVATTAGTSVVVQETFLDKSLADLKQATNRIASDQPENAATLYRGISFCLGVRLSIPHIIKSSYQVLR
jgi:hypothetical protein